MNQALDMIDSLHLRGTEPRRRKPGDSVTELANDVPKSLG